jgi:formate dehydrogenase major subunit
MAREIIHAGLHDTTFIERGTSGLTRIASSSSRTRSSLPRRHRIPADVIRDSAHQYAKSDRAMICWTLGITEHHNVADNVVALINPRCSPVTSADTDAVQPSADRTTQGGGDMGASRTSFRDFRMSQSLSIARNTRRRGS